MGWTHVGKAAGIQHGMHPQTAKGCGERNTVLLTGSRKLAITDDHFKSLKVCFTCRKSWLCSITLFGYAWINVSNRWSDLCLPNINHKHLYQVRGWLISILWMLEALTSMAQSFRSELQIRSLSVCLTSLSLSAVTVGHTSHFQVRDFSFKQRSFNDSRDFSFLAAWWLLYCQNQRSEVITQAVILLLVSFRVWVLTWVKEGGLLINC